MADDDFRRRADAVRGIPLEVVLPLLGAERDRRDRSQWRTTKGPLTVTGPKFFNWHLHTGGGGAIDLVVHLTDRDPRQAIDWLCRNVSPLALALNPDVAARTAIGSPTNGDVTPFAGHEPRGPLRLPKVSPRHLDQVRRYLLERRGLLPNIVNALITAGMLYADERGNAVFVMVAGKPPRTVGAELRGTTRQVWHGLAPGTSRDAGYFWIGTSGARTIILCESAIDAISCYELRRSSPTHEEASICISTAGVRSTAPWLPPLLARGYHLYCGFDDDAPGHLAGARMISHYPSIQRLIPPAHDWNDALTANHKR